MAEVWDEYRDRMAGGWKCVSYEMFNTSSSDGTKALIAKPHGDKPLGRLVITSNGWLSAHLARPERMHKLRSGKSWETAPDKEVAYVARGLAMYCGHLKLFKNEDGGLYWQTAVEISSDPNWVGGLQERKVILSEEGGKSYMTLEPKQDMTLDDGTKCRAVLTWERFE